MRFIILLLIFGFISSGASRPQAAENESGYVEYEESAADEYINDKQNKDTREIEERSDTQDETLRTQELRNNEYENLMEGKQDISKNENADPAEDERALPRRHKSNKGHDETEESADYLEAASNSRFNTFKRNQNGNEYRSADTDVNSNDANMENDHHLLKDKVDYNNEAIETHDQPLYKQITYYNKVQGDLFHKKKPNSIFNSNRDRREITHNQEALNDNRNIVKKEVDSSNEDSISAIKRNIKKLSREELEELLNSLSDDKRALLNKIISNKIISENVNKREITKKAGAVEENSYLENSQSDLNKLESGSSVDSVSALSQSETTETTKQSESSEISKTKASETDENTTSNIDSKDELSDINVNVNQESVQNSASQLKNSDDKEKLKNENKRETNIEEISPGKSEMINESLNNNDYDSDKDSNWSELMKDESELHETYSNVHKRGVDDYTNTADVKSLEDSFPYYEAENTKVSDAQMAPLIRVKRTNNIKRSLDRNPSIMKVPYCPGAFNDDDTDKDEFDDGSNFENSYNYEKVGKEENKNVGYYDIRSNKNSKPSHNSEINSAKIGSDTDNVLTNIEGVDDNLMYNNEIRTKRTADDADANKLQQGSLESAASLNEDAMINSPSKNDLHYPDQDAFGAIQRDSNEELGRYKRIRRLKQLPSDMTPH